MKRTPPQFETTARAALPDFDDEFDFKEIYWPDFEILPGETSIAFRLRFAFTHAGYKVIKVEEVSTHPVLIVRAIRKDAQQITGYKLFARHVRDLLRQAGFRLRRDELTVNQTSDKILVAFLSGRPAIDFEKILRESREDLFDYANMPL